MKQEACPNCRADLNQQGITISHLQWTNARAHLTEAGIEEDDDEGLGDVTKCEVRCRNCNQILPWSTCEDLEQHLGIGSHSRKIKQELEALLEGLGQVEPSDSSTASPVQPIKGGSLPSPSTQE